MIKKLNKRSKIVYWTSTIVFAVIILNLFLEREIHSESDLTFKNIQIKKIQGIKNKNIGNSISITDSENNAYRVIPKIMKCKIRDIKKEIKKGENITIGYVKDYSIASFFLPYHETFIVRNKNQDYIDFNCVVNESHFGKRRMSILLLIANIAILYLLYITQAKPDEKA